ncbi:MAG: recombinase family protein [Parasphingorhabdus sp.]
MSENMDKKAVIYARVSSVKQTTRGSGLESQETRCREFAGYRGYEVVKSFSDDMTGSVAGRPGMQAMLKYLRSNRKYSLVVIIDDISRLARGLEAHLRLRDAIASAGASLESPSIEFGEDSDSKLIENLLASVSQHQRQKNGEQTTNRMRARMMNGYWVFQAPWGYRYERQSGGGKILVRDEPMASIITEGLEGFASGRFSSQAEVKRFFESKPQFPKCRHGVVLNERVKQLLTQTLYAGYLVYPKWDVTLREGQHENLISLETFERIQERLATKAYAPARKNISEDFPMRGFVCCADCGHPMTSTWAKGRTDHYAYDMCRQRGCRSDKKSVARAKIEDALHDLVNSLTPSQALFGLADQIFRELWESRAKSSNQESTSMRVEIGKVDEQISKLLDRLIEAESSAVVKAYETKVDTLERKKMVLNEKIAKCGTPIRGYDETFQTAMQFLSNPWNLWETERLEDRRAMLKLVFGGHIKYDRENGFQTPEISLPFKALKGISGQENGMAHPRGFEPLASAFGGQCAMKKPIHYNALFTTQNIVSFLYILKLKISDDLRL